MQINEARQSCPATEDRWYIEAALRYMFDVEQMEGAWRGGESIRMREAPVTISYITREEFERRYGVWGYQKKTKTVETHGECESHGGIVAEAGKGGTRE